ncbi:hypothetical protein [Desulfospira joergensenii]|uniref:hypothetical protein n=1 Tax=Desulfospira joergensenii TaxID=53329 RepID=UPI00129466C1|nr:hypothetical protein [Desulfospira joergensenii]
METEYFKAAFKGYLKEKNKSRNWLAKKAKVTQQTVNNLCNGSFGSERTRDKLFDFMGTDFLSFLQYGKDLFLEEGNSDNIFPIDPSVQLLNECLMEAERDLNQKQREAVVQIIRKHQNSIKEEVKDILKAF